MLFPGADDVRQRLATGQWYHQALADDLEAADLNLLRFDEVLAERAAEHGVEGMFDGTGHFLPHIDRMLAEYVHAELQRRDLVE